MRRATTNKIIFTIILVIFSIKNSSAQILGSISGKILDSKSKLILPGASVYLASTAIGVVANSDGSFLLQSIQPGKYDLTVSMLGYKTYSKPVILYGDSILRYSIYLEAEIKELNAVKVTAKRSNNNRIYFDKFKQLFLGQTKNSSRCSILNPHDIFVFKDGTKLFVRARKPVEVENKALGYLIYFDLKEFSFDYFSNEVVMSLIPRFAELSPKNDRERNRWNYERDRAYYGSVEHFFRSLKSRSLEENHFKVLDARGNKKIADSLLRNNHGAISCIRGRFKIIYDYEHPEFFYRYKTSNQESTIGFISDKTELYENGYYAAGEDVMLSGYFGWSCRAADMVPLGYQPSSKLK